MLDPKGVGLGDKNYPETCLRGVFSNQGHIARSAKHLKGFIYVYVLSKITWESLIRNF